MFNLKMSGKIAAGILTSIMTLSLSVNVANATSTNGTDINLRSEASTLSSSVTLIKDRYTEVNVLDVVYSQDGYTWVKVSVNENEGFIRSDLLTFTGEANATILDGPTRIRKSPSLESDSNILKNDRLNINDRVQVLGQSGTFYCILYKGQLQYIHSTLALLDSEIDDHQLTDEDVEKQIEEDKKDAAEGKTEEAVEEEFVEETKTVDSQGIAVGDTVYTNVRKLNFRTGMALDGTNIKGSFTAGTKLTILETYDEWYKVSYNGDEGYIAKQYVSKITEGNLYVDQAMELLGKMYNESFNGVKLDCSGLTYYVYKVLNGVNLPRTCREQCKCGIEVSFENLMPGDLVFFINNTHVGMYIGEGKFIQAENNNIPIRVTSFYYDDMDWNYWAEHFTKAVRLIY